MKLKLILFSFFVTLSFSTLFAQSFVEVEMKTGSDNLEHRDYQKDLELRIILQGKPDVVLLNANNGRTWNNNSTHIIKMNLSQDVKVADIKEVQLHRGGGTKNNIDGVGADNWNLQKIVITASIARIGETLKYDLYSQEGTGGKALFRFIYENRNQPNDGQEKGYSKSFVISAPKLISGTTSMPTYTIKVLFKTGGDDLRGGDDNVDMFLNFKTSGKPPIVLRNMNSSRKWRNFSNSKVERPIPPGFDLSDLESIDLRHTGGGGISADNWYLDKLQVIITVNQVEYMILDKEEAPIHYFTGDTRKKTFRNLTIPSIDKGYK